MAGSPMEAPFFLATAVHLLREIGEGPGDPAGGVVGEDALARGGGLGCGDGARHHGVEDAERGTVLLPDGALDVERAIREQYGTALRVFDTVVPRAVSAAESAAAGESVFSYDASGRVARAFADLAEEVDRRG